MTDEESSEDEVQVDIAICGWICARVNETAIPMSSRSALSHSSGDVSTASTSSTTTTTTTLEKASSSSSSTTSKKKKKSSKSKTGPFLSTSNGQALQAALLKQKVWCRVVLGTMLFFENDKTTLPLRTVELAEFADVIVDDEETEKDMASDQRDLYYESDTPTESAAKVLVQLANNGASHVDLLVPAGFGWPDTLRAGLGAGSGAAAYASATQLAATERGGTRRWAFRAKKAFAGKLIASASVKKAASAALPAQTTQVLDAFRVLLAPRCKLSPKEVERDLLKIVVKWYFFAASNTILIDDVISVDNVLRGAVTQLAFVHGDGTLPAGIEMPADVLARRKDDEKGAALEGKLEGKALSDAIDAIVDGLREGLGRAERLLAPHVQPKTLARLTAVTKVFTDRELVTAAATHSEIYDERDQLIKTLEANWLSRDTRSDVLQWQKKAKE
jgi:hypothetical protein